MKQYELFLETGPKRMKTLVHAPGLSGSVNQGPTADQAIAEAPAAIRQFLRFLARHGEPVDPDQPFGITVVAEDRSGRFLGTAAIDSDLVPIGAAECRSLLRRLEWLHADVLSLVESLDLLQLEAAPERGRPVGRILSHVLGAEYGYLGAAGFRVLGLHALAASADRGKRDPREVSREAFELVKNRLEGMTDAERLHVVERSTGARTVRRMYRRLLEHNWEHYQELVQRLGGAD